VIGLVQVGKQGSADRYTYVPMIGIFLVLAWGIADLVARWPRSRHALAVAAVAVLAGCMMASVIQVGYWRDGESLWRRAIYVDANNDVAWCCLAEALALKGDMEGAVQCNQQALHLNPQYVEAHHNLGCALDALRRPDEAIPHYAEAVRLRPDYALAHCNLAVDLAGQGKVPDALAHFDRALEAQPDLPLAHNNLGRLLRRMGKKDQAVEHFVAAVRADPDFALAQFNLGIAFMERGQLEKAVHHLREARRLEPGNAKTIQQLGRALARQGRANEALASFQEAADLEPGVGSYHWDLARALSARGDMRAARGHYHEALRLDESLRQATNRTAWALATHTDPQARDGNRALQLATEVCEVTSYQQPAFLDTLAAAYAEVGRFDKAQASVRKALALLSKEEPRRANDLEARLQLYVSRRPFRDPSAKLP
jgi:tetratricopeptide (TPR) repeat protein